MRNRALLIAACLGAATIVYLVYYVGFGAVASAIESLGFQGFGLLCALGIGLYALLSVGWFVLVPQGPARRWAVFFWGRAVRDSAGEVLPLSQFGGFVIGARAVALRGVASAEAYASTVVDVTTEMLAQIVFVVLGVIILVRYLGVHSGHADLLLPLSFGAAFAILGAAGFIYVQRRGPAFAESLAARLLPRAVSHAGAFARAIAGIYENPSRLALSTLVHLAGWLASAAVGCLAVGMIGGHISYLHMVAIESALSAIRSAAVIVPSAMGVQEATYAMLMPLFGVPPGIGVALSLVKRACNIAIGIPVLLSWQGLEGRHALALEAPNERLTEN